MFCNFKITCRNYFDRCIWKNWKALDFSPNKYGEKKKKMKKENATYY